MSSTADQLAAAAGAHTAAASQMAALLAAFDVAASEADVGVARFATAAEMDAQALDDVGVTPKRLRAALKLMHRQFFVDVVAGDDANDGTTPTTALATVNEAVARVPIMGATIIRLLTDVTMTANCEVQDKRIWLRGSDAVGNFAVRSMTFQTGMAVIGGTARRVTRGFNLRGLSTLYLEGVNITVPDIGALGGYGLDEVSSPFAANSGDNGVTLFKFSGCAITIPATRIAQLVGTVGPVAIDVSGCTFPAELNGAILLGITNSAGTAATSVARLLTNLGTI